MKRCDGLRCTHSNVGGGGCLGGRPHIGPDDVAELDARVGLELDLLAEAACGRLRRHVDALPGHIIFPAVIGAAQAVLLVAAEPQRHAAMGAEFVHQAEPALRVAKRDQPLAEQLHPHRRTVRPRQFLRHQRRDPVAAKQLAHRRAGAGAAHIFVLFVRDHFGSPEPVFSSSPYMDRVSLPSRPQTRSS